MSILKELSEDECEMEMTPMIDVTFLLLIFFMCTLKFKTLEGKLAAYLPKDVGVNTTEAEPIEKVEILLRVQTPGTKYKPTKSKTREIYGPGDTGRYVWGEDRVLEYTVATFRTTDLVKLRERLTKIFKERKALGEEKVLATIDARSGTVYEDVVDALDQAIFAGFNDITFVGAYADDIK